MRTELPITGMTCASCAARVQKQLNRLDGVAASVNYATETASITFDPAAVAPERLVEAVEQAGYGARLPAPARTADPARPEADPAAPLRRRFLVSAALTVPVVLLSMIPALQFDGWQWVALALATPVVLWAGWPFHRAAWANMRHGAATMDTLVSLGTLAAWGWSVVALVWLGAGDPDMRMRFEWVTDRGAGADQVYLEVGALVTTFLLAGRWFEARAKRRAGAALRALLELGAKEASVLGDDGAERRVPAADVAVGDRFVVRPGEQIATDGVVEQGASAIDASLLTGETRPRRGGPRGHRRRRRRQRRRAPRGARHPRGRRHGARPDRAAGDGGAVRQGARPAARRPGLGGVRAGVLALAVMTLTGWLAAGAGATFAFTAAVAVLIIACPCALGLATPTALLVGTGRGAQLGILIRGPEVLESTRTIDTVVLDKTGTVTSGRMALTEVVPADGERRADVLRLTGALEDGSEHPIAGAIARAAREELGVVPPVEGFASSAGLGVEGVVEGHAMVAGRPALLADRALTPDATVAAAIDRARAAGRTPVAVAWDGRLRGVLVVADTVRPTSAEAVRRLRDLGLRPALLTGDAEATARAVAAEVGIEDVIAGVMPDRKADVIRRLQAEGRVVAMVGDGVNDAPALAQADLGVAMGTGTDVAMEAPDLTLVSGDLRGAADAIRLSRRTLRTIKVNLAWAFGYNVAALPLAAMG